MLVDTTPKGGDAMNKESKTITHADTPHKIGRIEIFQLVREKTNELELHTGGEAGFYSLVKAAREQIERGQCNSVEFKITITE